MMQMFNYNFIRIIGIRQKGRFYRRILKRSRRKISATGAEPLILPVNIPDFLSEGLALHTGKTGTGSCGMPVHKNHSE